MKYSFVIGLIIFICFANLMSCSFKPNKFVSSVRIKFVLKLDNNQSLYWFNDASLLTSEGYNYFQITNNMCDLSFNKANVLCFSPIAVLKRKGDTIFVVAQDSIQQNVKNNHYKIIKAEYNTKEIDSYEIPNYKDAFFLRDTCHKYSNN